MNTTDFSNQTPPRLSSGNGNLRGLIERNKMSIKLAVIGFLTLLLLIPLGMVSRLINERKVTKENAVQEITSKWSGEQIVTGPCVAIPYIQERVVGETREVVTKTLLLLPEKLEIEGGAAVESRKRGIYDASVYKGDIMLGGTFDFSEIEKNGIKRESLQLDQARVIMGITDLKGIREKVVVMLNGKSIGMEPGIPVDNLFAGSGLYQNSYDDESRKSVGMPNVTTGVFAAGVSSPLDSFTEDLLIDEKLTFSVSLDLNGSMGIYFVPVGKTTTASIHSDWATPSFGGEFLPMDRNVSDEGFSAEWKVLDLNRSYGQVVHADNSQDINKISSSVFGVKFIQPVDQYQQNLRSAKYGVLIILLTFVTVLFIEFIRKKAIGSFHYLLVGLALVLFYALLLSMSEVWGFNLAYTVAALMTVAVITFHMAALLRNRRQGLLVGLILTSLYLFIFLLIRMESYSLLVGSLGLFAILAVIMFYARKIKT